MRLKALTGFAAVLFLTLFAAVCFGTQPQDQSTPSAVFPETSYEFPAVLDGAKVVHEFVIQNKGTAPLKVERVKTG
jgi:hypothetical protein